jgi:hypothetical protein
MAFNYGMAYFLRSGRGPGFQWQNKEGDVVCQPQVTRLPVGPADLQYLNNVWLWVLPVFLTRIAGG